MIEKDIKLNNNNNYNVNIDYNVLNKINDKNVLYEVPKGVIQLNNIDDIKFFDNVKITINNLKKQLQNNKKFKEEYAIILELEEYFNLKNIEELDEKELEELKVKIKDIFVNTLYNSINKKKEFIKKETIKNNINVLINLKNKTIEKSENIFTLDNNIIIDFTELFFISAENLVLVMSNTFFNKLKEKTIENIQLNLETKYLKMEAVDKDILIKKLKNKEKELENLNKQLQTLNLEKKELLQQQKQSQQQLKNNNNKELQQQLNKLKEYIKQIEQQQKKLKAELKEKEEKINLYSFNVKTSNSITANMLKQKQNRKLDLHPAFNTTNKRKRKQQLKI